MNRIRLLAFAGLWISSCLFAQDMRYSGPGLSYWFDRGYGQVEVGGIYAGAEFHGSRPLPSRISLYYPVANSIDLSKDYWARGESRPFAVAVRFGRGSARWLGKEPWHYVVSPHKVIFTRREGGVEYAFTYEFFEHEPGMAIRVVLRNRSPERLPAEIYTHLKLTLRTCQSYVRLDSAETERDTLLHGVYAHFDEPAAGHASLAVINAGMPPESMTTDAAGLAIGDTGTSTWIGSPGPLDAISFPRGARGNAAAVFTYRAEIPSGDSMLIVQALVAARRPEIRATAGRVARGWREETGAYERRLLHEVASGAGISTGEPAVDNSARWALGLLASNRHYLDSSIVPMPCPAEYNFFFTHDVLLTDLGAVHFDLPRVRRDLLYISSLARDSVIPHAYYWRDDGFKTEYCTPDNWNHLWFILTNGSYLRHSLDTALATALYPLVTKSLQQIMLQYAADGLMHAFRPDWWDIGRKEGARSYITILTIRALEEYLFISCMLGRRGPELLRLEQAAATMRTVLVQRLWDDSLGYLVNYNGTQEDRHIYMGSLLAATFGLLDSSRTHRLVSTASQALMVPGIGVRTVWPVDFNTDSMRAFFNFVGNEAGDPYVYANGGIWPHCNAFYAMALQRDGRPDEALRFLKDAMTVEGTITSPLGQPAMYEYRNSNPRSPELGKVDKPSFLWAGGFYLHTLYRLLGVEETPWNVSFGLPVPSGLESAKFMLTLGTKKSVVQRGAGELMDGLSFDGALLPSRVIPLSAAPAAQIQVRRSAAAAPCLEAVNAILDSARSLPSGRLRFSIRSFEGHQIVLHLHMPRAGGIFLVNGRAVTDLRRTRSARGYHLELRFAGDDRPQHVEVIMQ